MKQGATTVYEPYGTPAVGGVPDNSQGGFDYGWLGQHQRPLEQTAGLQATIQMGARPYAPVLGRFLELDPIPGGATDSDHSYVDDPVNAYDLNGQWCGWGCLKKKAKKAAQAARNAAKAATRAIVESGVKVAKTYSAGAGAMAERFDVSIGGCVLRCFGVGQQGGNCYWYSGTPLRGLAFGGGLNVGLATKPWAKRQCEALSGSFSAGSAQIGLAQNQDGSYQDDWSDVEFAGSVGYSAGVAHLKFHGPGCE